MATVGTNEFKNGLKVMLDNHPHTIVSSEFVKPGKGQAFTRVRFKNLLNQRIIDRTFKSGETIELANVVELSLQYLYNDGNNWHFMDSKTYDQYTAPKTVVGDAVLWIKEQDICEVILYNHEPIQILPPTFVELEITGSDPGVRGDTATGGSKPATLETGAIVKVPLFVETGDIIRIDTRTGEYVGRGK